MTSIIATLYIESDTLPPNAISEKLGVIPDQTWLKGTPRGATGKLHITNSWQLLERREVEGDMDLHIKALDECLLALLKRVANKEDAFRILASGEVSGLVLGISCPFVPPLVIGTAALGATCRLGVPLEIDLTIRE
jgi:hypothetical protein